MTDATVDDRVTAFCQALQALDAGDRARLKRCAGRSLAESTEALGLFYRLLPHGVPRTQEEIYFMVGTLYPLAESSQTGNLGAALQRARSSQSAKGIDRRVDALLDADATQLPFRLRQAVRYLRSQRIGVEWPCLLQDLLYWTHPNRFVQRAWARSYYGLAEPEDSGSPEAEE